MEVPSIPQSLRKDLDRIRDCDDTQRLVAELAATLEVTVHQVIKAAAIIRRLEELGVEVQAKLDLPVLPFLRKIAFGQMSPGLLVKCQGNDLLLDKASQLPMPDQERVAANEPIKVMGLNGGHRMVPPSEMTQWELKQVFGKGAIRGDGQQVGWLRARIDKESAKSRPSAEPEVFEDVKRRCLIVRGLAIPAAQLAQHLARLTAK